MKYYILPLFAALFVSTATLAKGPAADTAAKKTLPPIQKFFIANSFDGAIFSSATIQNTNPTTNVVTNKYGTLRFSYFINYGLTFNWNAGRHFGVYAGADIKNIGFIEKLTYNGNTAKRRVYTFGIPVGIKIGNMAKKGRYLFLGGGADVPFNYKEKQFVIRGQKTKFNEWFSDRTPMVMPYVFAGASIHKGITLKAQYYPNNFLNPDFTSNLGKIYAGYDVHLLLLSVGVVTGYTKSHDMVKKHVAELNTM